MATATVFDINGLRARIKSLLDTSNTSTASDNLSASMSTKVSSVYLLNPSKIRPQTSNFPNVCIYTDSKNITHQDIARDQSLAKRGDVVNLRVSGMVYNANMSTKLEDPADKDLEYLMENIELILRNNPNLQSFSGVRFQRPTTVTYFDAVGEDSHLRGAIMDLEVKVHY